MFSLDVSNIVRQNFGYKPSIPQKTQNYKVQNMNIIALHQNLEDHISREENQFQPLQDLLKSEKQRIMLEEKGITIQETTRFYIEKIQQYNSIFDIEGIKRRKHKKKSVQREEIQEGRNLKQSLNQTLLNFKHRNQMIEEERKLRSSLVVVHQEPMKRYTGDDGRITNYHFVINSQNLAPVFNELSNDQTHRRSKTTNMVVAAKVTKVPQQVQIKYQAIIQLQNKMEIIDRANAHPQEITKIGNNKQRATENNNNNHSNNVNVNGAMNLSEPKKMQSRNSVKTMHHSPLQKITVFQEKELGQSFRLDKRFSNEDNYMKTISLKSSPRQVMHHYNPYMVTELINKSFDNVDINKFISNRNKMAQQTYEDYNFDENNNIDISNVVDDKKDVELLENKNTLPVLVIPSADVTLTTNNEQKKLNGFESGVKQIHRMNRRQEVIQKFTRDRQSKFIHPGGRNYAVSNFPYHINHKSFEMGKKMTQQPAKSEEIDLTTLSGFPKQKDKSDADYKCDYRDMKVTSILKSFNYSGFP